MRLCISLPVFALLGILAGQAFGCAAGEVSSSTAICGCTGDRISVPVCKVSTTGGCNPGAAYHHCSDSCSLTYAASCTVTASTTKVDDRLEVASRMADHASSGGCAALSGASLEEWVNTHHHANADGAGQEKQQTGF